LDIPTGALDAPAAAWNSSIVFSGARRSAGDGRRRSTPRQPTTHRAFDEATAILAGDALQVLAFSLLARDRAAGVSFEARLKMIQILADASGTEGMAGGQALISPRWAANFASKNSRQCTASRPAPDSRERIAAAACAPELTPAEWDALDAYSQDIGLAFQIQDDILDVEGSTEDLGKTIGADAARAKPPTQRPRSRSRQNRARDLQRRACATCAVPRTNAGVGVAASTSSIVGSRPDAGPPSSPGGRP